MPNNTTDLSMDNLTDLQRRNLGSYVGKTPNYLIELTLYHVHQRNRAFIYIIEYYMK